MDAVRVGVLGCGNVGGALVRLLTADAAGIADRTGVRLELTRVAVRDPSRPRSVHVPAGCLTGDAAGLVTDPEVDVVVELIGGIEPARGLVRTALQAGKPVITANKELLAHAGAELFEVASRARVDLLYEAAVAGGIPLIRPLRESLAGERITRVMGIVNGTTNYILTRMAEEGASYADALAEAQELGYAESDPTADVEGYDAAAKAAILATIAFGGLVVAGDVSREGITGITAADIAFASRLGYVVKLLAVAERADKDDDEVAVRVHPAMVPATHPLAAVRGSFNAVFIEGDAVGELMLYGRGAGGMPTASAVLGDLIDAAHNLRTGGSGRTTTMAPATIRPMAELCSQYYLNMEVVDRPGVLAAVSTVTAEHGVSLASFEQEGLGDDARMVFITHKARERDIQDTLEDLRGLDVVKRVGSLLRVIGPE
ncbi:MAG TPA: homoserine dehydrogenase [Acidimicrobiales bacterium]|nr:homoserine dehydrogenase [Acidimicrobiales bacterium]